MSGARIWRGVGARPLIVPRAARRQGYAAPNLASNTFEGGTIAPYTNPFGSGISVIDDPTGGGAGKVAAITYTLGGPGSYDRSFKYTFLSQQRYGQTFYARVRVFIPSGGVTADNRKLLDMQGSRCRMTLHRVGAGADLKYSLVDAMATGIETETAFGFVGVALPNDVWHTIGVRVTLNSADTVRDGILEVWVGTAAGWTLYKTITNAGWITENGGASYVDRMLIGTQLSSGAAASELRYFNDVAFSTVPIGPA